MEPLAPHIAEDLWHDVLKKKNSIHQQPWPKYDPALIVEDEVDFVIQINGRVRAVIKLPAASDEQAVRAAAEQDENVKRHITGQIKKVVFVPGKLINLIVS